MQQANQLAANRSRELELVERAYAESGLRLDGPALDSARASAEATLATLDPPDRDGRQEVALRLCGSLLARASPPADSDPSRIARLADRLAADLDTTRARVACTLLSALGQMSRGDGLGGSWSAGVLLALLEASDRRLARIGFDLHDGPLQELLLLGEDLRLFREQLASLLGERDEARPLRGRIEDLEARSVELERGLRQISRATGASVAVDRPLLEELHELTSAFAARAGIAPVVRVDGGAASISPSQRIALLSVVREALSNVREHSRGASEVEVSIELGVEGVLAHVRDDGCGFDVDTALLDAARRGHIGLAGIYERVRLLDGECVVDSRPGGPTTVALKLPRWEPPVAESAAGER